MDQEAVRALFDRQLRREARSWEAGVRLEHVGHVVRRVGPKAGWNGVVWSGFDGLSNAAVDAAVAEQARFFRELGREAEWKTYGHDEPADLGARLAGAGFVAEETETLMIAPTAALATDATPPEGIELLPVTRPDQVGLVERVHDLVFEDCRSSVGHEVRGQLERDPATVPAVVALHGAEPVSAARLELHPGTDFASLWSGGTVPGWRGRGIYRALVAFRARVAAERGFRYLQVDASADSRPILQRLGFTAVGTTTPYVLAAAVTAGRPGSAARGT
ncbi:GNAT family N-acetyltransferase [Streptomyces beihaiensis]|uniref:GNAT family N-acetyltransferase n=1 Tax=Streptomyces beihaiensis TaxID=2984495 RepID=A0ABT3U2A9_9ACTN|nr:GNAT family N-acetyltransferase [Streptomyces beihaiensis]MCX3062851.1 GNAT family N-acetyltransferase [Streptomyces beihaiensis]